MNVHIRPEKPTDYPAVFQLIERAFQDLQFSDHQEHFLVERLRNSSAFIADLSLVAEQDGQLVGHILLTKIKISDGQRTTDSLALAPVSVLPEFQRRGIGGRLINHAHEVALQLGHHSVVLLGHPDYYPKFGYKTASGFGISLPFEVPDEACMAVELIENGLAGVQGTVEYLPEFFEQDAD